MRKVRKQEPMHPRRDHTCSAFSLMELIVSVTIMSVVLVATGSAVVLASKSLPSANSSCDLSISAAGAADQLATELHSAVSMEQYSPTMIEFTVERNAQKHIIRYEWSGNPGDPLTRRYDGGTIINVLDDVQDFVLTANRPTSAQTQTQESGEICLLDNRTSCVDPFAINMNNWVGQYFLPSFPVEATSWRVTRVLISARLHGTVNGLTMVQLRPVGSDGLPTSTVLSEQVMDEGALTKTFTDQEFSFSNAGGLVPGSALSLVLQWVSDADSADALYNSAAGSGLLTTSTGGGSWVMYAGQQLYCAIYGTYTTEQAVQTNTLESVSIAVSTGLEPTIHAETEALILNKLELPEQ